MEEAIKFCIKEGKNPQAIIFVSLYGMPFMVKEIMDISREYEVLGIKGSAEDLGSCYKISFAERSVICRL
ncbi:DegT/DnrJ/EryC1/StrS family aminotransferase [Chryseobacterium sp. SN22]|uniref:DegT/DnrJ/EryC1/StrS family aminotransferase n=1 Tax=Chryseobacterium sp. SN22 TaxID=2606431 RepID=UPI0029393331|nr:DegT/DnrJ/EryC1/StrS family aminotransferase [Chryseobacterium sp. SN22]